MEYGNILKQSFEATKKHRMMWLLGMLVMSSGGCNLPTSFSGGDISEFDGMGGASMEQWFEQYWWVVVLIGLGILVVLIVLIVLHTIATGGMIHGAKLAAYNQPVHFRAMFKVGTEHFLRIFGLNLLVGGAVCLVLLILFIPLILLGLTVVGLVIAIPAGILLLLALIPAAAIIHIVLKYAAQYIVLHQKRIMESLQLGWKLFRHNLSDSVVMYLLNVLIGFGVGIVFLLLLLMIALPFGLMGWLVYLVGGWSTAVLVVGTIGFGIIFVVGYIIKGIIESFNFHLWYRVFATLDQNHQVG